MLRSEPGFTIFVIATGKYITYFKDLYNDLSGCANYVGRIDLVLLTDQNFEENNEAQFRKIKVYKKHAAFDDWVSATLLRFKQITKYESELPKQNIVWLDADMRIVNPKEFCEQILAMKNMTFARHPGFLFSFTKFRNFGFRRTMKTLISYTQRVFHGQIFNGTWENNRISSAYIKSSDRRRYIHGAIWGGPKENFVEMCRELDRLVDDDLKNDYIALWHDESHINRYFAANRNTCKTFTKYFSGADGLTPKSKQLALWSVDKNSQERRVQNL